MVYAGNALELLTPSPEVDRNITLKNEKGRKTDFSQFEGKDVYIQIFQSDCVDCIREMLILKELNKQYGDKIQFVSLNVDMDKSDYERFCKQYKDKFDWPVLYFNGNYDWLMEQGVETLPDYMIVNSSGRVILRDAPAPEHGLTDYLLKRFPPEEEQDDNPLFRR